MLDGSFCSGGTWEDWSPLLAQTASQSIYISSEKEKSKQSSHTGLIYQPYIQQKTVHRTIFTQGLNLSRGSCMFHIKQKGVLLFGCKMVKMVVPTKRNKLRKTEINKPKTNQT